MKFRKPRIDPDVLELIEHLFRAGTRGLLSVPPWQLGEVLLGGGWRGRSRFGAKRSPDADRTALVRAALAELAWALRSIAVLRLAAAPRGAELLLLERGVAIGPAALAERLIERFGTGGVLPDFLATAPGRPADLPRTDGGAAGEAQRTTLLAELALELAPSDAARITLALARGAEGRADSALALLRDVLTGEPDACDAASAWLDVAARHAAAGRSEAASRAAERGRALLEGASAAPDAGVPETDRWPESVPV